MIKINKFWILTIFLLLFLTSFVSAIDYDSDVTAFIPLFNQSSQSIGSYDVYGATGFYNTTTKQTGFDFDGVDDRIVGSAIFTNGVTNLYIEATIKPDTIDDKEAITIVKDSSGGDGIIFSLKDADEIYVALSGGCWAWNAVQIIGANLLDGNEHTVAFNWDGTEITAYIDGVASSTSVSCTTYTYDSTELNIGNDPYSPRYYFDGQISDVKIFNTSLSSIEIEQLYNGTTIPQEDNLVFSTDFDTQSDLSNNSNNAQGVNGVTYDNTTQSYDFDGTNDYVSTSYKLPASSDFST